MLKLVVVRGALSGQTLSSSADAIRIGRAEGNDFVIPDEHVSSEHARIALVGDRIVLRDLRSTNGTWVVRGEARSSLSDVRGREMTIEQGDVIELGSGDKCVAIQVAVDASPDARVFALRYVRDGVPFFHRQIAACLHARIVIVMVAGATEQREALEALFATAAGTFRFRE